MNDQHRHLRQLVRQRIGQRVDGVVGHVQALQELAVHDDVGDLRQAVAAEVQPLQVGTREGGHRGVLAAARTLSCRRFENEPGSVVSLLLRTSTSCNACSSPMASGSSGSLHQRVNRAAVQLPPRTQTRRMIAPVFAACAVWRCVPATAAASGNVPAGCEA